MQPQLTNFSARARVVDLLGREQIADAPTAISELLKNAIDALAENATVSYDSIAAILAIEDDGLGMRTEDLLRKWLVLATNSKRGEPDEKWLSTATKAQRARILHPLGEKGIGRLAAAFLARGVLVWTRWGCGEKAQRTLLFLHWSVFQHPRLDLEQITIPYMVIKDRAATSEDAKELFRNMLDWVEEHDDYWLSKEEKLLREQVVGDLRKKFPDSVTDALELNDNPGTLFCMVGTSQEVDSIFYDGFQVINDRQGDALNISEGLTLLLGFTDPFTGEPPRINVRVLIDGDESVANKVFWDPEDFKAVDHEIDITMDENGYVQGRIRVFREMHNYKFQTTKLPSRYALPGKLRIKLGYVEGMASQTLLTPEDHNWYEQRLKAFGALYVYRDGVRVLPYGQTDVDFLRFEERRTYNAGRYFFSYRRMFGGMYITRDDNPKLIDKAGREGFIKNSAYRGLNRSLIEVFVDLADTYYGRKADEKAARGRETEEQQNATAKTRVRSKKETDGFYRDLVLHPIRLLRVMLNCVYE